MEKAAKSGGLEAETLREDPSFAPLRSLAGFSALLERIERR